MSIKSHPPFPEPETIAGRNYWTNGSIRRWRAANRGDTEPAPQPDDDKLMTARQVREEFGGVSDMWLWRRRKASLEAAPKPPMRREDESA